MRRLLFALLLLLVLALPLSAWAQALYVSPAGNDDAEGTEHAPLHTLEEAFARLRKEKAMEPATIWLREGVYRLAQTIELTYRDRDNVAIRAYPGETPVITGDTPIQDWTETTLCDQPVWSAPLKAKTLRALYTEDYALQNARWPKEGFLNVAKPVNEVKSQFVKQRAFFADPQALPPSLDGAHVRLLHWWKDELSGVRGYDAKTGKITLNRSTSMTIRADDRYWLENVLSAPLAPGEWAYDAGAALLYYAPLEGQSPSDTTLYAGTLERLFTIDGVSGLTFGGITFARTGWQIPGRDSNADYPQAAYDADAAIHIRNGKGIAFEGCTFRCIGAGAIRLDSNVKDAALRDCSFTGIGAQALYVRGRNTRDDSLTTKRLTIENNHIDGYGKNLLNAPAVLIIHASDIDIAYNEIHDGAYTAISAGWVWGTGFNATDAVHIHDNLLYNIGQDLLADMGGVYTLGVQKSTVIRGNVIHDVHAAEYGGWGIYLDEGASGILVENNLVYRCSSQGFHQHDGVDNTVRNNVFAYSMAGQIGTSDKRGRGTFQLIGNLLVGEEPFLWRKYEKEKIDEGDNLYYTDTSPFVDLYDGYFWLIDDPDYQRVNFVPWENQAGRRLSLLP